MQYWFAILAINQLLDSRITICIISFILLSSIACYENRHSLYVVYDKIRKHLFLLPSNDNSGVHSVNLYFAGMKMPFLILSQF